MYVPDRVVTNDDLASLMDTSDEWIQQRTGIHERHWVEPGQQPSELAQHACERALEQADLEIRDIDCILLATLSSEHDFPGTSFFLHERLRAGETPCIDLRAQCSGFLYALDFGDALIRSGKHRRVMIVGCEVHSTGLDISTEGRDVAVIFGDGAGAVILEANDDPEDSSGILQVRTHAEGRHARRLWVEAPASGGTPRLSHEMLDEKKHYPYMEGRYVFKHAVTRMPEVLREALSAASIKLDDVSLFLFHQANLRINEFVAQKLELPEQKIFSNIQRFGNCSAASIPMLMAEASSNGLVEKGQIVSLTAFGSGFTWGSAVLRW
jgi:3-oxoacyl-[acyl-carrier-protein] synthase-3